MFLSIFKAKFVYLKTQYGDYFPASFFLIGFLIDIITSSRIDSLFTIIQHAIFLLIIGTILYLKCIDNFKAIQLQGKLAIIWNYRVSIMHFLFGGLLSSYTIFYFKSSSLWTSIVFVLCLLGLLVANEFKRFRGFDFFLKFILYAVCLISYFTFVVPIIFSQVGHFIFLSSVALSLLCFFGFFHFIHKKIQDKKFLLRKIMIPVLGTHLAFYLLYVFAIIPPVPISIQYMGIYHDVKRENGVYKASYTRSKWKFWQAGDQTFYARDGDKVWCFVRIFSPSSFKDQIYTRWLYKDKSGYWNSWDVIPFTIVGGRNEGFRGKTYKSNYKPGDWQVRIESSDQREIGRIYFTIIKDDSVEEIEPKIDLF